MVALPTGANAATAGCDVHYQKYSDWGIGFSSGIVVTNLGDTWSSYILTFRFTGNQTVTNGWGRGGASLARR